MIKHINNIKGWIFFFIKTFSSISRKLVSRLPKFSTVSNYVTMRVFDRGQKRYNRSRDEQVPRFCNAFIISRLYKRVQDFCNLYQIVCTSSSPAFRWTPIWSILGIINAFFTMYDIYIKKKLAIWEEPDLKKIRMVPETTKTSLKTLLKLIWTPSFFLSN